METTRMQPADAKRDLLAYFEAEHIDGMPRDEVDSGWGHEFVESLIAEGVLVSQVALGTEFVSVKK